MRAQARIDTSTEGVPLTLTPLLSAYGRHRRISLRIENLPERARLSRGRNNGDRSWSLMRDELEDLVFLPPQGSDAAHTVSVRIIDLESGDGETLALHDIAIEPLADRPRIGSGPAPSSELRKLREELARVKASLKASQSALAEEQEDAAHARAEALQYETALGEARMQFETELKARLAAAEADAATRLDASRAASAQDQNRRLQEIEARAQQRLEEARACWQQESEAALATAQLDWKSGEAVRLAEAEKQWHSRTSKMLADAEKRWEQAHAATADARDAESRARKEAEAALIKARGTWKAEETARLAAAEAEWRTHSDRAKSEAAEELEHLKRELASARNLLGERHDTEAALIKARDIWKADETARLAEAEAEWRARSDRAKSDVAKELEHLKSELAAARTTLGARERELAIVAAAAANAKAAKGASANDIAEARKTWDVELDRRIAEADAAAAARLETARAAWIKETQDTIAESDKKANDRLEELRRVWQAETAAALAQAKEMWSAEEAVRLAAAQARWREDSEQALESLRRDLTRSELPLNEASKSPGIDEETESLRSALVRSEAELSQARGELARARDRWKADLEHTLEINREAWRGEEEQRLKLARAEWEREERAAREFRDEGHDSEPSPRGRYIRDGFVGALLAAAAVFIYYVVIPAVTANNYPKTTPVIPSDVQPPPPPAAATAQTFVVVHGVNLRAGASSSAAVVATLAHGTHVALIEHRGDWTHVRVDMADGRPAKEGWIFDSYLKKDDNDE